MTYIRCIVRPTRKVEGFALLFSMFCRNVLPQFLNQCIRIGVEVKRDKAHVSDPLFRKTHTIIGLESLLLEIDSSSCPVCLAMVDRDDDDIFRENIDFGLECIRHCLRPKTAMRSPSWSICPTSPSHTRRSSTLSRRMY